MQKAITTVLTAMPSEIKHNLKQFRRYIQQWEHDLKTLAVGSQISLRATFKTI